MCVRLFMLFLLSALIGAQDAPVQTLRENISLAERWLFQFVKSEQTAVIAADWQSVTLPHTWNAEDGSQILNAYRRGYGYYQRSFIAQESWRTRSVFLSVGAANALAIVRCNGVLVGEHRTGFTAIRFNLTPFLRFGETNDLQIEVDNRESLDYPPLISDYTFFGGIYRDVALHIIDPVHVSLTHHGSDGVYLVQTNVTAAVAHVQAHIEVANDLAEPIPSATVMVEVIDHAGEIIVSTESAEVALPASASLRVVVPIEIRNARLWDGRRDPYCYRVNTHVLRAGKRTDTVVQPLGLRFFSVDPERGFILNGKPYDLHGVSLHQDRAAKGWAISDADRAEDVGLIAEIGATCVRLVHYPHAPATISLLDKAGIVAWSEIPIAYRLGRMPAYEVNCRTMLTEMICQLYNHPSICFWGLFNEISGARKEHLDFVVGLNQHAKNLDSTRLTTGAAGSIESDPICDVPDVIAFNRYFGWYMPGAHLFDAWAQSGHKLYPERRFGLAEFGADGDIGRHADRRTLRTNFRIGLDSRMGTEEYQTFLHEEAWRQIADKPYVWCKLAWNMADWSRGGIRNPTAFPSAGIGRKGLVTHDRQIRKDAFYWYKANWSQVPVLHIAEGRFTEREFKEVDLRIYCNVGLPTVTINGTPLTNKPLQHGVRFLWPNVVLPPGKVTVTASLLREGKTLTHEVTWMVPDVMPVKKVEPPVEPDKAPGF